jgi:1-acyl-sn-glycerol-3-phosphate acyltransferase
MSLLLVGIWFVLGEFLMWLTVEPMRRIAPGTRQPLLKFWVRVLRDGTVNIMRMAGARFEGGVRIPDRPGILMVGNHQSLVDIPAAFLSVPDGYPQMVAHHRYMKGIPLVSHILRVSGHIPVYPGRTGPEELERLRREAREARHPIMIYPEGHRTHDGEIRRWKRAGLVAFRAARPWTVYVLVVDGLWHSARIPDFIRTVSQLRVRTGVAGPFEYDGTGKDDHTEFIDGLERVMCDKLAEMRGKRRTESRDDAVSAGPVVSS